MPTPSRPTDEPDWIAKLRQQMRPWREKMVVVAVSGGSDSVGLLKALASLGNLEKPSLSVAHLDHGIRGAASVADAEFVADLSDELGLPFDLGRWAPESSSHLEIAARRARYRWLAETARKRGASAVAVGHTREDQAETILHRILRGTGLRGLAGMPTHRPLAEGVILIRPLLEVGRDEIRAFLETLGQTWREDAMNIDLAYTRSRLRLDLIPRLQADYNPKVVDALIRLGQLAESGQRATNKHLARLVHQAQINDPDIPSLLSLRLEHLSRLPESLRAEAIRLAWRSSGLPERAMSRDHWKRLALLAGPRPGTSRFSLPGRRLAERRGNTLRVTQPPESPQSAEAPKSSLVPLPGQSLWGSGRIAIGFDSDESFQERIDAEKLQPFGPPESPYLLVRSAEGGERFAPLGMSGRSMRLVDFLRGRRVPEEARQRVPLLVDRLGIVWVVGHRIADRVRWTEGSRQQLGLRWEVIEGTESAADPGCD